MRRLHCAALLLFAGAVLGSCSHKVVAPRVENQRPIVRLTNSPAVPTGRYSYTYTMHWIGYDPDGSVESFQYAIDPAAATPQRPEPETTWVETRNNEGTFAFSATIPDSVVGGVATMSTDYHVFVIKAVDNKGLSSEPAISAFNSQTVAPSVTIYSPLPHGPARLSLTPSLDIQWIGIDPDGIASKKPVFYRTILLTANTEVTPALALQFPDTLRKLYLPRGWAGWDSLGPQATYQHFSTLAPDQDYAFCIVAFDEAGAFTPTTSSNTNLLYFRTVYAQFAGPKLTIFNDFFTYTYANPVYRPDDARYEIALEVPANAPFTVNWTAEAYVGTTIGYYRWVLDPADLADNRARTNERTDLSHWSQASALVTKCDIPPIPGGGDHHLYIEAADNNGLRALGHVHFVSVIATFDRPLGIVDDTRLLLDRDLASTPTCVERPLGRWPTAAELDTFLYARGGIPIKCYPAGYVSRRGLFNGYDYDTISTRTASNELTVPLSKLAHYRNLIWLVDPNGPDKDHAGSDQVDGKNALRYMSEAGHSNTLGAYIRLGGEVWLAGGGCLHSTLMPWNVSSNDRPVRYFTASAGEIRPGRFIYDFVHWRSDLKPGSGTSLVRNLGRLETSPGLYAGFPQALQLKDLAAGDSVPAWRTGTDFYQVSADLEAMMLGNSIVEDYDPSIGSEDLRSTLDTLYRVVGGTLNGGVAMTVYHGLDNARVIESGFTLWSFQAVQLRQLIDGVLGGFWGMTRAPAPMGASPARMSAWQPNAELRRAPKR